ncbi:MAG TPA: glycosyltransferase family 39 protein, partial [Vicinamibacterales bacterium]|nr:glycosyltransferase family 39 protein [Vicinamibacterales bacterium]
MPRRPVTAAAAGRENAPAKAEIIADRSPGATRIGLAEGLAGAAMLLGLVAVWVYAHADLTLSHYDAKAHLVVARRVLDSLTPGWKQIGAVWLPLPHLLNLVPVQVDVFYRTGASAVAISVLSFGLAAWACARLVLETTGSRPGALLAVLALATSPDLLYLQATPMTEALLVGLTTLAVLLVVRWVEDPVRGRRRAAGAAIVLACLTRYEAWPVTAAALGLAAIAFLRRGVPPREAGVEVARLALYPVLTVIAFLVQSRLTIGKWFVTGGFFVAENPDLGRPFKALGSVWWGSYSLYGYAVLLIGTAGASVLLLRALRERRHAASIAVLALFATAALPWYAFFQGHPFRIRYMIPLLPALAVSAGIGVGLASRRARWAVAALAMILVAWQAR